MIVDRAIYVDGHRTEAPEALSETYEVCRQKGGMAWIGLHEPSAEEFSSVAGEFGLHPLAVEDAIEAHQRPKLERYGETLFVVLKPARYVDETESVEFGEIHVFAGPDFVITIRHGEASALDEVRQRLEEDPELLKRGSTAILYAIMDQVVDDYAPVVEGLENDIDEIEVEVFGGNPGVSRRIYQLSREVIQFQRATKPLEGSLDLLLEDGKLDPEVRRYLRDVRDHVTRVIEQIDGFRELLSNALYHVFTRDDPSAAQIRSAVYRVWAKSGFERERTMRILMGAESRRSAFGAAFARMAVAALSSAVGELTQAGRFKELVQALSSYREWAQWPVASLAPSRGRKAYRQKSTSERPMPLRALGLTAPPSEALKARAAPVVDTPALGSHGTQISEALALAGDALLTELRRLHERIGRDPDWALLRSATRIVGSLRQRCGAHRIKVALTRFDPNADIGRADVEKALGGTVHYQLPNEYRTCVGAITRGEPLIVGNHSQLASSIGDMARHLGGFQVKSAAVKPGLFGRLGGRR